MNEIIDQVKLELNISKHQIENTLKLLEENNTIPFIARYRKELTGNLNEVEIKKIKDLYDYKVSLEKRKSEVIRLIEEKEMMTDELKEAILSCKRLIDVEEIYRPYKERKKSKASLAKEQKLEGLAKDILKFPLNISLENLAMNHNEALVESTDERLNGAKEIIKEYIFDNQNYRTWITNYLRNVSVIKSKKKKDAVDDEFVYKMYYEYEEKVKTIAPHRILAMNRGEKEGILSVSISKEDEKVLEYLERKIIKNTSSQVVDFVKDAIKESYKKQIFPSVERVLRNELDEKAELRAIENFAYNLENLLLTPPLKKMRVLGFDPAFRTGCKLALLDEQGSVLKIDVIYPHEPQNQVIESKEKIASLVNEYKMDIIAIGNGTASRESEAFIAETIKEKKLNCKYIIVSEAGASVYSASPLAIKEFPDLDVSKRSAISIARRIQDPLSELVKIDPKSIGVGLYQHDVNQKNLMENLNFTVEKIVGQIGVNINTASSAILSYVSGLKKQTIDKILKIRDELGGFKSRNEFKKKVGLSDKTYEQAIGFLRVTEGENPLDKTYIHPESYDIALKILELLSCTLDDLGSEKLRLKIKNINEEELKESLNIDIYTLKDILEALEKPLMDVRENYPQPILKSSILKLEDLQEGMKLQGTVRNVVDFGAFIDIGLKNDGLCHISHLKKEYVKDPSEVVEVGQIVDCYVLSIDQEKKKVSLSLVEI